MFSDIYLNYLVGQVLIGGSRKGGTSRLERVKKSIRAIFRVIQNVSEYRERRLYAF